MHDFAGGGDGSWAVRLRREGFAGMFEKRKRDRTDCGKYRKQRLFLLYGQSGEITAGLDIDPSMYDPGFEELCDVREKPYGYLLIFSGGFMAVDETLTPVKTVRFSELAWFERKWIFNGDSSFNPYDVSEDFRYLVLLGGVNYIVDLENGNVLLAQKGERERGIVLPDGEVVPGDFRVSGGMVTAAARLAGVENGLNVFSYGIFRFNLSTGEKSFAGLEGVGSPGESTAILRGEADYFAKEKAEAGRLDFCRVELDSLELSEYALEGEGLERGTLEKQSGDWLVLRIERNFGVALFFVNTQTGQRRTIGCGTDTVKVFVGCLSEDGSALVTVRRLGGETADEWYIVR